MRSSQLSPSIFSCGWATGNCDLDMFRSSPLKLARIVLPLSFLYASLFSLALNVNLDIHFASKRYTNKFKKSSVLTRGNFHEWFTLPTFRHHHGRFPHHKLVKGSVLALKCVSVAILPNCTWRFVVHAHMYVWKNAMRKDTNARTGKKNTFVFSNGLDTRKSFTNVKI